MPINNEEFAAALNVALPPHVRRERDRHTDIECEVIQQIRITKNGRVVGAIGGSVTECVLETPLGDLLISVGRRARNRQEPLQLIVADLNVTDQEINCSDPCEWLAHPMLGEIEEGRAVQAIDSWKSGINFGTDNSNTGLREPQKGALHALGAHWSLGRQQSLVVMPTGTGKTEVMLAALVQKSPRRLLVLVPSDPLRAQTVKKFVGLGLLKKIGVVAPNIMKPVVGVPRVKPNAEALVTLQKANVVISTVAMLSKLNENELTEFIALFDLIFIDEAHHAAAPVWSRILEASNALPVTGFTATPFRNDGSRISGKIVYQYPLARAQDKGYFGRIRFAAVDEIDPDLADRRIADLAIARLREDRANGHPHILLARAGSIQKAEALYAQHYSVLAPDLAPVVVHSDTPQRRTVLDSIRAGNHQIVVCVDMFGEGVDIPALKIAAMHDVYKSLSITLQFVGRFTRTAQEMGSATLIANLSDDRVGDAIKDLYAEDADWNLLIPELSARAIEGQIDLQNFVDQMQGDAGDESEFNLEILKPATSTVIYRTDRFNPRLFKRGMSKNSRVKKVWFSRDRTLCIFVTKTHDPIDWAHVKTIADEIWHLTVCRYNERTGLLFINSSQTGTLHKTLASAVSSNHAVLISGEQMFRAYSGYERLVFQNVGLTSRGKTRFKMFTGFDVSEAIAPAMQANSMKSNMFAVGYESGRRNNIGVSQKGKVWSMSSSNIPTWQRWCDHVSMKITNGTIPTDVYMQHTLIPEEVTALPDRQILCVLPPDDWLHDSDGNISFVAEGQTFSRVQVEIASWNRRANGVLEIVLDVGGAESEIELRWANSYSAVQMGGVPVLVRKAGAEVTLQAHLCESPPVVLFNDGSELIGSRLLKTQLAQQPIFDRANLREIDWAGVDITLESKWRNGTHRDHSVQGKLIDECLARNSAIVYDDDDKGEIADVVEISITLDTVAVRLYHCKFSGGAEPGMRVGDLYVVCGQAARSVRVVSDPEALLTRLEHREHAGRRGGRPTRFERGDLKTLRQLRKRVDRYRFTFEIVIVQPGLKRDELTVDASSVLASADMYIRQFTGMPMIVYGSGAIA